MRRATPRRRRNQAAPRCLAATLSLALLGGASAPRQEHSLDQRPLPERITEHRLENGWRFLFVPRGGAPVVSFETLVATGARREALGSTGTTNLLTNLLFKGSDRIGTRDWQAESEALTRLDEALELLAAARSSGDPEPLEQSRANLRLANAAAGAYVLPEEFSRTLEDAGGGATLNAYCSADTTRFVVSLPANQLELWCWMEAERFSRPVLREFLAEREAVLESRRTRIETNAAGQLGQALRRAAYRVHPYGRPVLGRPADLERATPTSVRAYLAANFGARQMTTVIVGDFDPARLLSMVERYFSSVPAGPRRLELQVEEPAQKVERRVEVSFDGQPQLMIAWHVPAFDHPDSPAVEVAVRLLGFARSSRLERRLIRADAIASEVLVSPAWGGDWDPSLAWIHAIPNSGVHTERLERAIYEEIEQLTLDGPARDEMLGVKRVASAEFLRGQQDNATLAAGLAESWVKAGDWRAYFARARALDAVRSRDVRRVLRTYFVESGRTVATLVPQAEQPR